MDLLQKVLSTFVVINDEATDAHMMKSKNGLTLLRLVLPRMPKKQAWRKGCKITILYK